MCENFQTADVDSQSLLRGLGKALNGENLNMCAIKADIHSETDENILKRKQNTV